jgi:hypothetical protein
MDHQIMRPRFKIKAPVVGSDCRVLHPRPPKISERRNHGRPRKPSVNLGQSFLNLVGGILLQKQGRIPRSAYAVAAKGDAVGQDRGCLHGGQLRGMRQDCKLRFI